MVDIGTNSDISDQYTGSTFRRYIMATTSAGVGALYTQRVARMRPYRANKTTFVKQPRMGVYKARKRPTKRGKR